MLLRVTPKKDLRSDRYEVMFLKGKEYLLEKRDNRYRTIDEQGLKNIMREQYIEQHFYMIATVLSA